MPSRLILRLTCCLSLLGLSVVRAEARDFYVNANTGTDGSACVSNPGSANPCKTISYVTANATLESDVVHVQAGTYYENVKVDSSDGGSSEASRVRFVGEGGTVTLTGLDPSPLDDSRFVSCTAAANCAGDGQAYSNVYKMDVSGRTAIRASTRGSAGSPCASTTPEVSPA
jgi:hypothetical protein